VWVLKELPSWGDLGKTARGRLGGATGQLDEVNNGNFNLTPKKKRSRLPGKGSQSSGGPKKDSPHDTGQNDEGHRRGGGDGKKRQAERKD